MGKFMEMGKISTLSDVRRTKTHHMCACGVCNESLPLHWMNNEGGQPIAIESWTNEAGNPPILCSSTTPFCFTDYGEKRELKNYIRAECAMQERKICWMCTFDLHKRPFASEFQLSTDEMIEELRRKFTEFKKVKRLELNLKNDQDLMARDIPNLDLTASLKFSDFGVRLLAKSYSTVWLSSAILGFVVSMLNNLISHFLIHYSRTNDGKLPALKPVSFVLEPSK
jgi:hypothetical protein